MSVTGLGEHLIKTAHACKEIGQEEAAQARGRGNDRAPDSRGSWLSDSR